MKRPVWPKGGRSQAVISAGLSTILMLAACGGGSTDPGSAAVVEQEDWGALFEAADLEGTFAVRELGSSETLVWDSQRADEQRIPASTFKVLNSLVILQTGTLADVDTFVPWDGVEREVPAWNADQSLRTGIEVSAVWAYQALAREVGEDSMAEWVERSNYGNADIGGGIDRFWLSGDLRISPLEQLVFLERLVEGELPFDDAVMDQVNEILVREAGEGWSWSHKTGTALSTDPELGWLVGSTRNGDRRWVFALNVDLGVTGPIEEQIDPARRVNLARELLVSAGALPA